MKCSWITSPCAACTRNLHPAAPHHLINSNTIARIPIINRQHEGSERESSSTDRRRWMQIILSYYVFSLLYVPVHLSACAKVERLLMILAAAANGYCAVPRHWPLDRHPPPTLKLSDERLTRETSAAKSAAIAPPKAALNGRQMRTRLKWIEWHDVSPCFVSFDKRCGAHILCRVFTKHPRKEKMRIFNPFAADSTFDGYILWNTVIHESTKMEINWVSRQDVQKI